MENPHIIFSYSLLYSSISRCSVKQIYSLFILYSGIIFHPYSDINWMHSESSH